MCKQSFFFCSRIKFSLKHKEKITSKLENYILFFPLDKLKIRRRIRKRKKIEKGYSEPILFRIERKFNRFVIVHKGKNNVYY